MFPMYRVMKVTPGIVPGLSGAFMEPLSGWTTRARAQGHMFEWAPSVDSRSVLQIETRFTGTMTDNVIQGQKPVTRWDI